LRHRNLLREHMLTDYDQSCLRNKSLVMLYRRLCEASNYSLPTICFGLLSLAKMGVVGLLRRSNLSLSYPTVLVYLCR